MEHPGSFDQHVDLDGGLAASRTRPPRHAQGVVVEHRGGQDLGESAHLGIQQRLPSGVPGEPVEQCVELLLVAAFHSPRGPGTHSRHDRRLDIDRQEPREKAHPVQRKQQPPPASDLVAQQSVGAPKASSSVDGLRVADPGGNALGGRQLGSPLPISAPRHDRGPGSRYDHHRPSGRASSRHVEGRDGCLGQLPRLVDGDLLLPAAAGRLPASPPLQVQSQKGGLPARRLRQGEPHFLTARRPRLEGVQLVTVEGEERDLGVLR